MTALTHPENIPAVEVESERAVLGPFRIEEHRPGSYLLLARNPNYWKAEGGRRLPYLDRVLLEIVQNRDLELLRFRQGQVRERGGLGDGAEQDVHPVGARGLGPVEQGEGGRVRAQQAPQQPGGRGVRLNLAPAQAFGQSRFVKSVGDGTCPSRAGRGR